MPELPEVETVVRALRPPLTGRVIGSARLTALDLYRRGSRRLAWLAGGRIVSVERMGKAIVLLVEPARPGPRRAMVVHLGMTGRFLIDPGGAPGHAPGRGGGAARHLHARIVLRGGGALLYYDPRRFGYVFAGIEEGLREALRIGPDPFEIRPRALAARLEGRTAPIKSLLLDQRLMSGLGNIYADETLFAVCIHPATPGGEVAPRAGDLLTAARAVLRRAIGAGGTTFRDYRRPDGSRGRFQGRLAVYGREGEPCPVCGSPVARVVIGGRSSHYCPRCQPRPRSRRRRGTAQR